MPVCHDRGLTHRLWSSWLPPAALAAIAFAAVTALVGITQGAPVTFLLLDTTGGLVFIAAGAVAWHRRPDVITGPLLIAAAALWFVGSYAPTGIPPLAAVGAAFETYYDVVLAFLVLSFPTGKLTTPGKVVVATLLGAFLVRSGARLFALDLPTYYPDFCAGCPPNPFVIIRDRLLLERTEVFVGSVIVIAALAVMVLAIRRLRPSSRLTRRVLTPVVAAGSVAALAAATDAASTVSQVARGSSLLELPPPWDQVAAWAGFGARALIPLGFLVGTLRLRIGTGPLAKLVVELDSGIRGRDLDAALREALGDPSARLLRWSDAQGTWTDVHGTPVPLPTGDSPQAVTVLERTGRQVAAIVHHPALREDRTLLSAVSAVLAITIDNEGLTAEVRRQLEEVRASRARLVESADAARERIERDLHDGAQQRLVSVALALQDARTEAARRAAPPELVDRLAAAADELRAAVDELRELARGIHPAILTDEGLGPALATLARRAPIPVDLDVALPGRPPPAVEATTYYVVAEALTNVARHARASTASVHVRLVGAAVEVEVADDGIGGAGGSGGGLRGLSDRVAALGGSLAITSPPGSGTRVRAVIPCA